MPLTKVSGTTSTWQVTADRCPQNFGYNVVNMTGARAGQEIKADFKGIIGEAGYRIINKLSGGWRFGFVALKTNVRLSIGTQVVTAAVGCEVIEVLPR
jgi:hypothetical protein